MVEKIDVALGNQLKELYWFEDKVLVEFYNAFKDIDIEQKEKFLVEFNNKIENKNKCLNDFLIKIKLDNNKIKESQEFRKVNKENINL